MMTAPRGAAIVYFSDRRFQQRLLTRPDSPKQLAEPLRRLQRLRAALYAWDRDGAQAAMPQPHDFGLRLPDLRPSEVHWRAAP